MLVRLLTTGRRGPSSRSTTSTARRPISRPNSQQSDPARASRPSAVLRGRRSGQRRRLSASHSGHVKSGSLRPYLGRRATSWADRAVRVERVCYHARQPRPVVGTLAEQPEGGTAAGEPERRPVVVARDRAGPVRGRRRGAVRRAAHPRATRRSRPERLSSAASPELAPSDPETPDSSAAPASRRRRPTSPPPARRAARACERHQIGDPPSRRRAGSAGWTALDPVRRHPTRTG